ncbi:unnamed protein product [Ixodes hexagonus]
MLEELDLVVANDGGPTFSGLPARIAPSMSRRIHQHLSWHGQLPRTPEGATTSLSTSPSRGARWSGRSCGHAQTGTFSAQLWTQAVQTLRQPSFRLCRRHQTRHASLNGCLTPTSPS